MLTERDIDAIKRKGSINALKSEIQNKRHSIEHHIWRDFTSGDTFTDLAGVLDEADVLISDLRFLLHELQQLEPENK